VKKILLLAIALLAATPAWAQLQIEIISGNPSALPIAIVPFQWQEARPEPATCTARVCSIRWTRPT
jgi:Tol biopolymer transport system component